MFSPHRASTWLPRLALGLSLVLALVCLGVPAAQATGRLSAPITLKFQSWDPPDVTNQFIKPCEKLHPDIRVQTLNVPGDYAVKMETEFAAGKAPDFFYAPDADALKWAQKGVILDLLPYLKAMGINPLKDFLPQSQ